MPESKNMLKSTGFNLQWWRKDKKNETVLKRTLGLYGGRTSRKRKL